MQLPPILDDVSPRRSRRSLNTSGKLISTTKPAKRPSSAKRNQVET
ncbi:MAG: hypothetical protein Q7T58_09840 [Methylotenera sp.]|nr:hypothetical protein [Methylotenera sp.]